MYAYEHIYKMSSNKLLKMGTYNCCVVSQCRSTSIRTPEKLFIHVPLKKDMRVKWLKLARRDPKKFSTKSALYFCADHFDLPKDMANYMQYKIMGSIRRVQMIKGCLPSKFECFQKGTSKTSIPRSAVVKRKRLEQSREVERILEESRKNEELKIQETIEQTEDKVFKIEPEVERAEASIFKIKEEPKEPEELSNLHVEDFIWLDDVKVELPSVETDTSDYLANENIECETDIKVKQEFEQIEFISLPNIQFEENTEYELKRKEKQKQIKQRESLQKGTNEDIRPRSRQPKRSTKTPKRTADYCREYRQRIKEKHERFIENNSMEVKEASNINNPKFHLNHVLTNVISVNVATQHPEKPLEDKLEKKKYSCDVCNFKTASKEMFLNHKRIYIDKRSYKCDKCEYSTDCKRSFNAHLRTHVYFLYFDVSV